MEDDQGVLRGSGAVEFSKDRRAWGEPTQAGYGAREVKRRGESRITGEKLRSQSLVSSLVEMLEFRRGKPAHERLRNRRTLDDPAQRRAA